jgi:hypothetical protein
MSVAFAHDKKSFLFFMARVWKGTQDLSVRSSVRPP